MKMGDIPDWQKLVRLVGEDAAASLSATYGGGRLYIPQFLGSHHPITACVGDAGAARLVAEFGGQAIGIPMAMGKRAKIVQLRTAGMTVPDICRRVGVSRSQVFQVMADLKKADDQADLFRR